MKIRWVEATNFRKFVGTVRVDGIGDGINLLVGHNEMGKSTLMEAINGVIFEKAKAQTKETRSFRHFVNRTVPEVSLGFDLDGKSWTLKKRFAGPAGKAFLKNSDGRRYEDEEAETELQRVLGFTVSGRSTEPGIWGTLWVRQGHSFGDPPVDERARRTLHSCLEAQVGAVTGGLRGQRIPGEIENALAEIVSSRGPRGRYKVVSDQLAAANVKVDELEAKRDQLFAEMERLARLERELWNLNEHWSGEENARQTEAARQKRAATQRKTEEGKTARSDAALAIERAKRARADVKMRAGLVTEIEQREPSLQDLQHKVEIAGSIKDEAARVLAERARAVRALGERERQTAEAGRKLHRIRDVVLLGAELHRYEAIVCQAQEKQQEAERLGQQMGRMAATAAAITTIEKAEVELSAATAALNAVATTIALSIEKDAIERVTLDGNSFDASDATYEVVEDVVIGIAGVGDIAIRPQVKDREAILKRVDRARRALQAALEAADADSPTAARAAGAQRREMEQKLDGLRSEIGRLAPGDIKSNLAPGLDALKIKIEELRGRRDAEMTGLALDALPERTAVESEICKNTAEAELSTADVKAADAGLNGLRQAVEEAREEFEELRRKLAAEQRELDTKKAVLAAGRGQAGDDILEAQADGLERTAAELQALVTRLEQTRGETVEDIDSQIKRLENVARLHQAESSRLGLEIAKTSGVITAGEGDGIDEALDTARAEQSRLNAQVKNYEQEIAVLELLRDTLRSAETEAKARYLAPVITRVEPYLKMLLPATDLMLDEDLHIIGVRRNDQAEEFARLSDGTQEQIAVLTRLGFAELLLDQGRPATVILDDALVFSDDDRIERMFDIMTRAAGRMQIIVLTCRKRLFTRLGAPMLRIEGDDATPSGFARDVARR
jgi:DNA repair exonuclease SbcCD ATPase subunit